MIAGDEDQLSDCLTYVGIVSSDPDRVEFVFPRRGGKVWMFDASGPGVMAEDGRAATYPISSTIDTSANLAFSNSGECVNSVRVGEPLLHCTIWSDGDRRSVIREVTFSGNGMWKFDRTKGT